MIASLSQYTWQITIHVPHWVQPTLMTFVGTVVIVWSSAYMCFSIYVINSFEKSFQAHLLKKWPSLKYSGNFTLFSCSMGQLYSQIGHKEQRGS